MFPVPVVHSDFAALVALAVAYEQRPAALVEVCLGQGERLVDSQAGAPERDDQAAHAVTVCSLPGGAHDGDDLFDAWWVGRDRSPLLRGGRPDR